MLTAEQIHSTYPQLAALFEDNPALYKYAYYRHLLGATLCFPLRLRFEGNLYNPVNKTLAIDITRRSKWGNPFKVEQYGLDKALELYELALLTGQLKVSLKEIQEELKGKNLICWCKVGERCHGDILISYANY